RIFDTFSELEYVERVKRDLDGFPFTIGLDERGLPVFTKSQKQQLLPCMPEFVGKMVSKMRSDGAQTAVIYLDVEHEDWCDEFTIIRSCNCNPVLRDHEIEEYYFGQGGAELSCGICGESSIGEVDWDHDLGSPIRLYVGDTVRAYWRLGWVGPLV